MMTTDTFFEKFYQLSGAPNAVEMLRELILRLATSGRIAPQDPTDSPASELLTGIFAIRDRLIKDGKAKSRIMGVPIAAGDTISLPPSWARCMISEVCDLNTGATPSRQETINFGGDIPWLVSGDVNKGEIFECDGRITEIGLRDSNCKLIAPDSVLIALNGQGKTRGTVALLRMKAALNQSLVAMTPYSAQLLLPEYIYWNLRGRYYAIRDITGQDQRRGLNMKLVGQLSLPIPPLPEQKRIVAKVDELMALCDRLEARQQEREIREADLARAAVARFAEAPTPANLNFLFHKSYNIAPADLRKCILTLAVQGKLATQDPDDRPAGVLLDEIRDERDAARRARRISPMQPLPPVGIDELSFDLPPGWAPARLVELLLEIQTGPFGSSLHKSDYTVGGTPVVNPASIKEGKIVPIEGMAIGERTLKRLEGFKLSAGDIIMARRGEMGRCAVVTEVEAGWLCGTGSLVLRMPTSLYAPYVAMVIGAPEAREYLGNESVGTTMQNLNQSILARMPLGVPPLPEQQRIVTKVDGLMALVDELQAQLMASRETGVKLLEAVVAQLVA